MATQDFEVSSQKGYAQDDDDDDDDDDDCPVSINHLSQIQGKETLLKNHMQKFSPKGCVRVEQVHPLVESM